MAVRASVSRFPVTQEALDACGVHWGISVTPFAAADEHGQPPATCSGGDRIPRCERCWAYFNTYCDVERWGWACALCGTLNGFDDDALRRLQNPDAWSELNSSLPGDGVQARPVYVAAVDLASLIPGSLFGLMTFSHKIGLYDVHGPIPVVKNIFIPPDSEEDGLPVALYVDTCKDRIAAALETLRPTSSWERGAASA